MTVPHFPDLGGHVPLYLLIAGVAAVLLLAQRLPIIGRILSFTISVGLVVAAVLLIGERVQLDPSLARIAERFHLAGPAQQIVGKEMRVPIARDGHFWVKVKIGRVEQRMLVDSGATVTALSADAARAAGLEPDSALLPVMMQTANGTITAERATVPELRIGNVVARDLAVVVSPAFGGMNVIGMNFLSRLKSWRVEDGTLILVPHHLQPTA